MHPIDRQLYAGLLRMQRAYDALLSERERVTPAEIALSNQWQAELEPVLRDLYWYPLRNGIDQAPEDADELRSWLRERYDDATAVAVLLLLLQRYQVRSVNLGGTMALDMLGIDATFRLTNSEYLALLDEHATMLTTVGSDMSLIDTTIDDLARGIPAARKSDDNTLLAVGAMIAGWSLARGAAIAVTELTRMAGNGLNWAFGGNGVQWQTFVTREDRAVCKICAPLHGRRMPVNNIPADLMIPQHTNCRCSYLPDLTNWTQPATIWTGGNQP
jgi:SPP1 gp7 family putative phage head morphogenesis protein